MVENRTMVRQALGNELSEENLTLYWKGVWSFVFAFLFLCIVGRYSGRGWELQVWTLKVFVYFLGDDLWECVVGDIKYLWICQWLKKLNFQEHPYHLLAFEFVLYLCP